MKLEADADTSADLTYDRRVVVLAPDHVQLAIETSAVRGLGVAGGGCAQQRHGDVCRIRDLDAEPDCA